MDCWVHQLTSKAQSSGPSCSPFYLRMRQTELATTQLDMKSKRWEGEGGSGCMDKLRSSCQSHKTLASTFMWPPFVKFSAMTFALSSGMGSLAMQFPTINILLVLLNLISIVNIVCHNAGKGRRDHHLATMPAALADTIWTAFYLIQLTSNGCP